MLVLVESSDGSCSIMFFCCFFHLFGKLFYFVKEGRGKRYRKGGCFALCTGCTLIARCFVFINLSFFFLKKKANEERESVKELQSGAIKSSILQAIRRLARCGEVRRISDQKLLVRQPFSFLL